MSIESIAINYAQEGLRVFPIKANSKSEQVLRSWKEEATLDVKQIKQWFSNTEYNVGVRTGDGLIVIDVDNKNDKNGYRSIEPFLKDFPKTRIVKTANNGWHMYYYVNRKVSCKVNLYEGIDIRGEGGYVVGVGSKVNGNDYTVSTNLPIAQANDAIYEFIQASYRKVNIKVTNNTINEGTRNIDLFHIGCSLQNKNVSDETILLCLQNENRLRCNPPLDDKEIQSIWRSVTNYKKGNLNISNSLRKVEEIGVMELLTTEVNEEADIVEDMLPIGVSVFGAPQKIGKTFFCLQLALAVATGRDFIGKKTTKGHVLYIALEDTKSKLKQRLKRFELPVCNNLTIRFESAYNPLFNLDDIICEKKQQHPDLNLIIVDTFAKIRKNNKTEYDLEYEEASMIHEIGIRHKACVELVTHVKKAIDYSNPFDSIYGSRGLTAAMDSMMVMFRRNILSKIKELHITGKDIPEEKMFVQQNEKMLFEVVEEDNSVELVDDNLMKVINYLVNKKEYIGTHQELCARLGLSISAKGLQCLLKRNKDILAENFISYDKLPKETRARRYKMVYSGNETL